MTKFRSWVIVAILLVSGTCVAAQISGSSRLSVTIDEQMEMKIVNADLVLKIRLSNGVTAKLWTDQQCHIPPSDSLTFEHSGTYTIHLGKNDPLPHLACANSSDGRLSSSLLLHQ